MNNLFYIVEKNCYFFKVIEYIVDIVCNVYKYVLIIMLIIIKGEGN